jgi:hypothetical protein
MGSQHNQMSSPGLTGRPSTPQRLMLISSALEYWVPAFAGMTAVYGEALMPC